jgi:hypothetical protein
VLRVIYNIVPPFFLPTTSVWKQGGEEKLLVK